MTKADIKVERRAMQELLPQVSPEPWTVDEGAADEGCEFRHINGWSDSGNGEWLCLSPADAKFIARARSLMPALLDWADKAEAWARGFAWRPSDFWERRGERREHCRICGGPRPDHDPTCPLAAPEYRELFGAGASPNAELVERTSRLSVFLATLYASVERALAERRADGATGKERDSQ